ncbi:signal peptidase I [Vallitalea okinawensis]|uniref:signal peptidase I n=1 Tax=Vallitalea okinawensis TaxID=2078660 RepID=UPI000CFBDEB8|nr:signal peptidase I [Vallitalea okinawensis]
MSQISVSEDNKGKQIFLFIRDLVICVLIAFLFITFVAQNAVVSGESMYPTLEDGQFLIVNKFIYHLSEPERGDIIVFDHTESNRTERYIKRIIGTPGDEIDFRDGYVYINGQQYVEDYIKVVTMPTDSSVTYPITVPANNYFVLGDNRNKSKDSRYNIVGTVEEDLILGKASIRIWPITKFGFVE